MNNETEIQALINGVNCVKRLGFEHITIEINYELVVGCNRKNLCIFMYLWDFKKILQE